MELTILMPCLNEAPNLSYCIKKAFRFLKEENINGEVLIADNGSTDDSVSIALSLGASVIQVPQKGYGCALHAGILAAHGTYVIFGDSDGSYNFLELLPFLIELRNGADLVVGNRYQGTYISTASPFLNRYLGVPMLSFLGRKIQHFYHVSSDSLVHDFHCGLRGVKRSSYLKLPVRSSGMEYASEMILAASMYHQNIRQIPVTLYTSPCPRKVHLRPIHDGLRHIHLIMSYLPIKPNHHKKSVNPLNQDKS